MGRSLKKGPYVDAKLFGKDRAAERFGNQGRDHHVGAGLHDHSRVRWPHVHGPQRQDPFESVHHGRHGRSPARRIRSDAKFPRPRRQGQGRSQKPWRRRRRRRWKGLNHGIQSNSSARSDQRPQGASARRFDSRQSRRRCAGHPGLPAAAWRADARETDQEARSATPKICGRRMSVAWW